MSLPRTLSSVLLAALVVVGAWAPQTVAAVRQTWSLAVFSGVETGGTFYKAKSDGSTVNWPIPAGNVSYPGTEVRAELEQFADFGLRIGHRLGDHWGFAGSVSFSEVNVRALVRSAANRIEAFDWDQVFAVNGQVVATWDLLPRGNSLYLLSGVGWSSLGAEGSSFSQSGPTFVYGAGFRLRSLGPGLHLDFEFRDAILPLDLDEEKERLAAQAATFDDRSILHVVELTVAWVYSF